MDSNADSFDLEQHRSYTYHFYFHDGLFAYIEHTRHFVEKVADYLDTEWADRKAAETPDNWDPYFNADTQFGAIFPDILWRTTFLHSYFFLESSLNQVCDNIQKAEQFTVGLNDMKGAGIHRAALYLQKIVGVRQVFDTENWIRVQELNAIRNIFVHADGYAPVGNVAVSRYVAHHPGLEVLEAEFEPGYNMVSISKEFTSSAIDIIKLFFQDLYLQIRPGVTKR